MTFEAPGNSEPTAAPPDAEAIAALRHDLRTPVNHIIGFGELLIEEAEELGRPDLLPGFREILDRGRDLSALIDLTIPPSDRPGAEIDLPRLRLRSSALVAQIIAGCDKLRGEIEDPALAALLDDLGRIRTAANRLAGTVAGRLAGTESGPGQRIG